MATESFREKGLNVRILNAYEGNNFTKTGDTESSLLSILSVHPMTGEAVKIFLKDSDDGENVLKKCLQSQEILQKNWQGKTFYVRNLRQGE